MALANSIFQQHCATRDQVMPLTVRGLEFHLPTEKKYPHAQWRWVQIAYPTHRHTQEAIAGRRRQLRYVERWCRRREINRKGLDGQRLKMRLAPQVRIQPHVAQCSRHGALVV